MSATRTIDNLLIRWQELRRNGETPSVQELCADHPSLADELARRVAAFESMEGLLGLDPNATCSESGPRSVVPPHLAEKFLPLGYEILEVIDQGGMGVVYKAIQIGLRRTVALKMIAGFRIGPKQLARFRVEAEAVARLQHPHIVQIHEIGEVDGHSFFAMEFVEGGTLAHRLADGPLPPAVAAELLEVLARAIHHAHTREIVHRDLKPANILLSAESETRNAEQESANPDGEVVTCSTIRIPNSALVPKVSDFGLAKRLGAETAHTATGEVIGTPAYMAPEQARGSSEAIGPACDVYALGAILYEALTGRPPFQSASVLETLHKVISDEPVPPRRLRSDIPRNLETICLKCLEKNPAHRYASAEALADDLRRFLTGTAVVARRPGVPTRVRRWVRRRPIWAAAMILVVVAGVAVLARGYAKNEPQGGPTDPEVLEAERRRARAVEVAPQAREILRRHCYECHGEFPAMVEGKFKFFVLERSSLLNPDRGYVVPEHPEDSRLVKRIVDGSMPPEKDDYWLPRVSELELSILKDWIAGGAPEFPPEDPHNPTPPVVPNGLAAQTHAIFSKYCIRCHGVTEPKKGIKILNHNLLVATRRVIPGRPEDSELYRLLVSDDPDRVMPPKDPATNPPLPRPTAEEIKTVRKWIEAGAPPFPHLPREKE